MPKTAFFTVSWHETPCLHHCSRQKCQNVVRTELNSRIGPYALPLAGGGAKRRRVVVRRHPPPASLQPASKGYMQQTRAA